MYRGKDELTGNIKDISAKQAWEFLQPRHYAGRKPQISKAFGWFINEEDDKYFDIAQNRIKNCTYINEHLFD